MLRVALSQDYPEELFVRFPDGIELVRLPPRPSDNDPQWEADFWIPPFSASAVSNAWKHLREVKTVQALMAGVDSIRSIFPAGVVLCDGRGVHDIPVAEWVVGAILAVTKRLPLYGELQQQHKWRGQPAFQSHDSPYHGAPPNPGTIPAQQAQPLKQSVMTILAEDLHGKTVLIVGYGSIGEAIEKRLAPFGVEILRVARSAREGVAPNSSLPELLPKADIVVLVTPLTAETKCLFDDAMIDRMRPGALLVNAARGPVVKTEALVAALTEGKLYAALDVTDPEPLPPEHVLWTASNCLITPHIAGSTPGFLPRAFELVARQLHHLVRHEPLENVVTGDY